MVSRMMSYILVSIVTAFTLLSPIDSTPGNCYGTYYKTINDPRRSTGYDASNNTRNHLCDRHLLQDNAWYRFSSEAGGEMPTTRPKLGSCGTYVPIWMNGFHPTIEDGIVARKACANVPRVRPLGCGYSYNIHVRNCSGYYIYQLKTTANCILAYCAGSKVYNCSNDPGSCIANRPPYISMPDLFYAFENSEFQLSINATDPEGYVMHRYEYLPNKTVSKVSVDDETVTISINQSGKVSLRTTDGEKSKSSLHTINIIAVPCPCMNEGKCKSNKSVSTVQKDFLNFACACIQPYSGNLCELSPCTNLPCYPGVICTVTSDSYKCGNCPASYDGDGKDCELILTNDIVVIVSELNITSGLKWDDGLSNETSFTYKNLTVNIVNQITSAYGGTKEFLNVEVIRYRNESVVVVEFQVVLKEKMNDPLEPLRTRAMQNDSGIFTIDPNSVREKENRPPYINMPDRYFALKESEFQLVINATDPEGYPLRYSYLSNTTISSVSVDQKRKLVKISVKESGRVSLKVIDYGGIERIHTIEVVTIPCSCENGGKCYNQKNVSAVREDLSNFTCTCIQPYTGNLCELSPCTNLPCYPGVICTVTSDSYKCGNCPASYDGDGKDCELILTDDVVVIVSEFNITSGLNWDDGLSNETSFTYKNLTVNIVNQITSAYGGTKEFLNVEVIRYRKESVVVVEFQVVLKKKIKDPLEPLRTRAMQNDFGTFTIDSNSVREKENRPPYISMPDQYYALKDSEFQLVLNATDPEGYPLRYSYLSNTTISSVSVDQKRKIVKISVKESGRVSLKVRDYGGIERIHTIKVVTIPCSCENRGKCYNLQKNVSTVREDFSNFKCACVKPYTGRLCKVSPCDNLPCFPGVSCSVKDGRYKCGECPATLQGDGKACQLILTDGIVVIEGEMKIISGLKWNDDLLNKTSLFYKNETVKIVVEIVQAYTGTKEFLNVVIIRYRKGSVVVEFQVVLKKKMDDPLKPLRTRAMQNKFGIFTVDQHSVKEENSTEVDGTLNVVSGVGWKDDLEDKSSTYFKTMSSVVAIEINKVYANEKEFVYVFVTGFRSSEKKVVVEFKLVWRKKISTPLEKLQSETKDGKLGKLGIEKDSVKEKTPPTVSSNDPSYFGLHKAVFIVVVCLVSLLALMSMVVCGICIRKKHVSIIMLTTHHDDRHEFCPNNGGQDSHFEMKKQPAHNQVVDICSVGRKSP